MTNSTGAFEKCSILSTSFQNRLFSHFSKNNKLFFVKCYKITQSEIKVDMFQQFL